MKIISNGGSPIKDCPKSYEEAHAWAEAVNAENDIPVRWSFDCGFKLDFDGGLVRISSRFYPPKTHYGPTWSGWVDVSLLKERVNEKTFDCDSLEELRSEVEAYVQEVIYLVKQRLHGAFAALDSKGGTDGSR
jgi:hypothetical protein